MTFKLVLGEFRRRFELDLGRANYDKYEKARFGPVRFHMGTAHSEWPMSWLSLQVRGHQLRISLPGRLPSFFWPKARPS